MLNAELEDMPTSVVAMSQKPNAIVMMYNRVDLNECVQTVATAIVRAGPLYDTGDDTSGTQLIGKGKKLKASAFSDALQNVVHGQHLQGLLNKRVGAYPAASRNLLLHACTQALMWCTTHRRSKSRYRLDCAASACNLMITSSP